MNAIKETTNAKGGTRNAQFIIRHSSFRFIRVYLRESAVLFSLKTFVPSLIKFF
jgi:hypothetical protein